MRSSRNWPILYGAFVLCLGSQFAYAENEEIIAACARIATIGDRILCLEDALRRSTPVTGVTSEQPDTRPVPAADPEPVMPPVTATSPATLATADPVPSAVPVPAVKPATTVTAPSEVAEETPEPDPDFGLKQPEEVNTIQVTVTSVRKNLTNKYVFTTDGGQVWLQTDLRNTRYGKTPFVAEIRPASLGSFFLKPKEGGVSVRVRREE